MYGLRKRHVCEVVWINHQSFHHRLRLAERPRLGSPGKQGRRVTISQRRFFRVCPGVWQGEREREREREVAVGDEHRAHVRGTKREK